MLNIGRFVHRTALMLGCTGVLGTADASGMAQLQDAALPVIDGAALTEISEHMWINGVPTRIREFHVSQAVEHVRAHYRTVLGPQHVLNTVDGWDVLSRQHGRFMQTVRLKAEGPARTTGTLSESDLGAGLKPGRNRIRTITPPHGSVTSTDLEMQDTHRSARITTWRNAHSSTLNRHHLVTELARHGYQLAHPLPPASAPASTTSLWFAGKGREANAQIHANGSTVTVTLNLIVHAPQASR